MRLYDEKTGGMDTRTYDTYGIERRVFAMFQELIGDGIAPADAALLIMECASMARCEHALNTKFRTRPADGNSSKEQ